MGRFKNVSEYQTKRNTPQKMEGRTPPSAVSGEFSFIEPGTEVLDL